MAAAGALTWRCFQMRCSRWNPPNLIQWLTSSVAVAFHLPCSAHSLEMWHHRFWDSSGSLHDRTCGVPREDSGSKQTQHLLLSAGGRQQMYLIQPM